MKLVAGASAAARATWSRPAWRAVYHNLVGALLTIPLGAATGLWLVVWGAAAFSLGDPTNDWSHRALYIVTVLCGPLLLLLCVRGFGEVQRARFRNTVGLVIPAPPGTPGLWLLRPWRAWAAASTWRQFGYLLWAAIFGVPAGVVTAVCCAAPVLVVLPLAGSRRYLLPVTGLAGVCVFLVALALCVAGPWLARGLAWLDSWVARRLLGPSRSERLAQRVAALTRNRTEVLEAADAERRRIERDLHDGAQQRLVSLAMNLGLARMTLPATHAPDDPARLAVEQAHDEAVAALAELRETLRGLHPAILNDRGLDAALSGIAARAALPVRLRVDVPRRCPPGIETVAYFVVSEALTNVVKHAQATVAEVTVARQGAWLTIVVTDNGRGGARAGTDNGSGSGTGLRGLAQRADAVDGTLTVHSPIGGPTTLTVRLPCE